MDNEMAFELPETLPEDAAELEALREQAIGELDNIMPAEGEAPSDEVLAEIKRLDASIDAIEEKLDDVKEASNERAEAAAAIASKRAPAEQEGDEFSDDDEDEGDPESDDEDEEDGEDADYSDLDDEDGEAAQKKGSSYNPTNGKKKKKKDTAAMNRRTSFAGAGRSRRPELPKQSAPEFGYRLNSNAHNYEPGYVDTFKLAKAMGAIAEGRATRVNSAGGNVRAEFGHFERPEAEFTVTDEVNALEVLDEATNEKRLDGGSLVAAGGWCAPSETVYDFLGTEAATDLLSLPEIGVKRGGIKFPVEPEFSAIYTDHPGFHQTETQAIAGEEKDCTEIPCTDFAELRLDVIGLCITNGILADKAWPEQTRKYLDEIMKAHQHRLSAFRIGKVVDGSTAITMPAGIGAAGTVLNAVELAVQDIRIKHRIPSTQTIEGMAPIWGRAVLRADLAYRQGVLPEQVTDQMLDQHFRQRGANIQFVVDWQTDGIGGADAATAWPETLQLALWPSGTWYSALEPVISLGVTYDAAMLKKNRRIELFTEDGIAVGKRRNDSRVYTIPVEVTGGVGQRYPLAASGGTGN